MSADRETVTGAILTLIALVVIAAFASLLVHCHPLLPLPPHGPADPACDAAEARLLALGCEEATTPAGTPFGAMCRRRTALKDPLPAQCISAATSCVEARMCQ